MFQNAFALAQSLQHGLAKVRESLPERIHRTPGERSCGGDPRVG